MVRERVPLRRLALHQMRIGLRVAPDQEEGRAHAFGLERVENAVGHARQRPVVEGQHHFLGLKRQRARVGFEPDAAALDADLHHPRRAQRLRPAGEGGGGEQRGEGGEGERSETGHGKAFVKTAAAL